jgi:hypothetical protein
MVNFIFQFYVQNGQGLYSLYLNFRFLFFVMITKFVEFYVGTHGSASLQKRRASLQKPNFQA